MTVERCPGCGVTAPTGDGPLHPYLKASPGCWKSYAEVLAREYGAFAFPPIHRLTVDTYAAQHPGGTTRVASQAVAVHLAGLHLVLDRGVDFARTTDVTVTLLRSVAFPAPLDLPPSLGTVTVLDVLAATTYDEHVAIVTHWAKATWAAWSAHHAAIAQWIEAALTAGTPRG